MLTKKEFEQVRAAIMCSDCYPIQTKRGVVEYLPKDNVIYLLQHWVEGLEVQEGPTVIEEEKDDAVEKG